MVQVCPHNLGKSKDCIQIVQFMASLTAGHTHTSINVQFLFRAISPDRNNQLIVNDLINMPHTGKRILVDS